MFLFWLFFAFLLLLDNSPVFDICSPSVAFDRNSENWDFCLQNEIRHPNILSLFDEEN